MKKINGREFPLELFDAVFVTPEQIKEEFTRVPADLAYWNACYADAYKAAALAKHHCRKLEKRLFLQYSASLRAEGGKVTDPLIDAHVENDPDLIEAQLEVVETEAEKIKQFGNVDAVRAKRDMLVSLGATMRSEMEHNPEIKERNSFESARRRASSVDE